MITSVREAGRFERTTVFRSIGLFGFADILMSEGVEHPAEQMLAICQFVVRSLTEDRIPYGATKAETVEWSRGRLLDSVASWRHSAPGFQSWQNLAVKSAIVVAWSPYQELGELLCVRCGSEAFGRAAVRLKTHGFPVSYDMVSDLREEFSARRLPRALMSFDPKKGIGKETEWLATVFYRYGIQALVSDRNNQAQLEALSLSAAPTQASPEDVLGQHHEELVGIALPRMYEKLSTVERRALSLYFGLGGTEEATLAQIGEVLGISEYKARNTVIVGLTRLAALLGVQGTLNEAEVAYARALFVEGAEPAIAARRLNLRRGEIEGSIAGKFRQVLRARTVRRSEITASQTEENAMNSPIRIGASIRERIKAGLEGLSGVPSIGTRPDGTKVAWLGDEDFSLDAIFEALDRNTIDRLTAKNLDLRWILAGPQPTARADVMPDAASNIEELEKLQHRVWVSAGTLYELCSKNLARSDVEEDRSHTIERIYRTLAGTGQAIRQTMPRALRAKGEAEFHLRRDDEGDVVGFWHGVPDAETISMTELVGDAAQQYGELGLTFADALALETASALLEGETELPGFGTPIWATGDSASFRWVSRRLDGVASAGAPAKGGAGRSRGR